MSQPIPTTAERFAHLSDEAIQRRVEDAELRRQVDERYGQERAAPPAPRPPTRVRPRIDDSDDDSDDEAAAGVARMYARRRTTRMADDSDDELVAQPPAAERALTESEKKAAREAWCRSAPYVNQLSLGERMDYPASGVEYKCIVGRDDRLLMIAANQQYAERDAVEIEVAGAPAAADESTADQALKSINDLLADKTKALDAREKALVARENAVEKHEQLFECGKELADILQPAIFGRKSREVLGLVAQTLDFATSIPDDKLGGKLYCSLRDLHDLTHGEQSLGFQWGEYRDEAMRKYTMFQKLVKDDKMDPSEAIDKIDQMHYIP